MLQGHLWFFEDLFFGGERVVACGTQVVSLRLQRIEKSFFINDTRRAYTRCLTMADIFTITRITLRTLHNSSHE
jgi:hypothetical protein